MIHVVARSIEQANLVKSRHPTFKEKMEFHFDTTSYFDLINKILKSSTGPVCIIHDDVFLPKSFLRLFNELVSLLNAEWPNWGVCGNAGVLPFQFGKQNNSIVRYISDPHGGPNVQAMLLPVQLVDGNVMLLNSQALNARNVQMPPMPGFQFYDVALCISAIKANLAVLVAPQLCCYHDSRGSQESFDSYAQSPVVKEFLSRSVRNRYIKTLNGVINSDVQPFKLKDDRVDLEMQSLIAASEGRQSPKVAIVVRSQFRNLTMLKRNMEAGSAFIASAGNASHFKLYVITDSQDTPPNFVLQYAQLIREKSPGLSDTRNFLVKIAFENIDADWFWFVDDDDWLFPNEAERLGHILATISKKSIVFVGSQHFNENISEVTDALENEYKISDGRYFDPTRWHLSIEGENHIPFPGMLISRDVFDHMDKSIFDDIVYFEDFALQLSSLAHSGRFVVIVDKLYVGISIRPTGNTVTERNRTKWNISLSELTSKVCNDAERGYLSRL